MRNVKTGDLAIIVEDGGNRENVGLVVTVLKFIGRDFWIEFGAQPTWLVKASGGRAICYEDLNKDLFYVQTGHLPDCCLKRIAPDKRKTDLLSTDAMRQTDVAKYDEVSALVRHTISRAYQTCIANGLPLDLTNLPFDPATAAMSASLRKNPN